MRRPQSLLSLAGSGAPSAVGRHSGLNKLWVIPEKASSTRKRASRNRSKSGKPSGGAAAARAPKIDPEKLRELESLRLAKSNLERQAEATAHPVRKQQIKLAIAEIDKRLAVD